MDSLPLLNKNAYLTLLIKDNHIFANVAYSDFNAESTYILSDITDLSPLKFRMDDVVFNNSFWYEYFNSLERVFNWDIVDRMWEGSFRFLPFQSEGYGIGGLKILIDDNQPFFNTIYSSLKEFSKDITLRVIDDSYIKNLMNGLSTRLGYDDLVWLDYDLSHFSVFRYTKTKESKGVFNKEVRDVEAFCNCKIDWNNEIGLVDSIKNSKLQAFVATDISSQDLIDRWANLIAHSVDYISDPNMIDIVRSFTTVQNISIYSDNRDKLESIGNKVSSTGVIVTGQVSNLLPVQQLLISIVDGFEIEGDLDVFIDKECRIFSYGRNLIDASQSKDIVVIRGDVLPKAIKLLVPELRSGSARNKVIFSAKVSSQDFESREFYAINPSFELIKLPEGKNKIVVEGEFKNGAFLKGNNTYDFVSSLSSNIYEYIVVDTRFRPIVYGPKSSDNKVKLQMWLNGDKK